MNIGLKFFLFSIFMMFLISGVMPFSAHAEENRIVGGVDIGDLAIRSASYKLSNYDEFKQQHPDIDPKTLGTEYMPQRIRFSMAGSELVMKFRKLRLRNCYVGYWKEGFEAENVHLFAEAAKNKTFIILHNVTANKNGECYFESFSLGGPLSEYR